MRPRTARTQSSKTMAFSRKAKLDGLSPEEVERAAFDKIAASAAVCEQSTLKMQAKLEAAGFPAASASAAIEKACRLGVIDDRRYAECLVRSTIASHKGLRVVEREIGSLGIDIDELDAYQEYLDAGQDEAVASALEYLERHPPRSKNVYASCQRKLVSRGYDYDIATQATKLFMQEC